MTTPKILRIATRQSALALWQANYIKAQLTQAYPTLKIELLGITTSGDKNLATSLNEIGGKGLFVKELEQALLENKAEIAVHSMKDVPMDFPLGLEIPVICRREDPRDVLISNRFPNLAALPTGAVVGTSSLRRLCQLQALRPDLTIQPLRGNVDTRIQRLDENKFDAIILAAAGLLRLGLAARISEYLPPSQFLPAAGQGALGIECRKEDHATHQLIQFLNDDVTHLCVKAERALNKQLEGGCQVPIGAYAQYQNDQLQLKGLIGSLDGRIMLKTELIGSAQQAEELGIKAAKELIKQGAEKILSGIKRTTNGFES